MENPPNREQAQKRIDQIHNRFDADSSSTEKKLSWRKCILIFLLGLAWCASFAFYYYLYLAWVYTVKALCTSVYFFFYRFLVSIPIWVQIVIFITTPLLALLGMKFAARKEKSFYYATLAGLLAFVCFGMNLYVLGTIFNITPFPKAFLVWGVMALLVAYHQELRLILMAGLLCILVYIATTVGTMWGFYWLSFVERPEYFIIAGAIMVGLPHIFKHRHYYNFPWFYHLVGLLSIFIALLVMSYCGHCSSSLMEIDKLEIIYQTLGLSFYQMLGLGFAGIVIWMGIRFHDTGVTSIGATFFTIFLYSLFFYWWWDFLPFQISFFILSVISLGLLRHSPRFFAIRRQKDAAPIQGNHAMKKYGLIAAIALVVLSNVVVLAGVAYNRSGEPDATVTLTERELLWLGGSRHIKDSSFSLILGWNMPGFYKNYKYGTDYRNDENIWLNNKEKLAELGFDTDFPVKDEDASLYYRRQLPRQAYVVLEYNGDAYQHWLKEAGKRIQEIRQEIPEEKKSDEKRHLETSIRDIEKKIISRSHLVAVNAGQDPEVLRKQYSDQSKYIITPAIFGISINYNTSTPDFLEKPFLSGWVRSDFSSKIHVTNDYRSFFISDIKTRTKTHPSRHDSLSDLEPRYQVTLNYGQRYEPWIADVQKLK